MCTRWPASGTSVRRTSGTLKKAGPVRRSTTTATASTLIAATVADFNSEEAESVTLVRRWAHTNMVDEPIGFEAYVDAPTPGAGTAYEMYADRLGSILAVVDVATNALAVSYAYDGFGNRTATGDLDQPYGFTGREFDGESGLSYYRARYLDSAIGRFIQSDPLEFKAGDLNIHAYVSNDPFNWKDAEGLASSSTNNAFLSGGSAVSALRSTTSISTSGKPRNAATVSKTNKPDKQGADTAARPSPCASARVHA